MASNLERYKKDLEALIIRGDGLINAIQFENNREAFEAAATAKLKGEAKKFIASIPSFRDGYQVWYSEAKALVRQILPDRLEDFVRHYERPKVRKEVSFENYTIEDCLHGLTITRGIYKDKVVGPDAGIPRFIQQVNIVKAAMARFESSLFDIRQLVQADLFDSELDAAHELAKKKFYRGAGAIAGVVLEKHLVQVCTNHGVQVTRKAPSISDLNDLLKANSIVEIAQWRFIQHLGDIRNLCDHQKDEEPGETQVDDLLAGVDKVIKTLF